MPKTSYEEINSKIQKLSRSFEILRGKGKIDFNDMEIDVVLPYLMLNADNFGELINQTIEKYPTKVEFILDILQCQDENVQDPIFDEGNAKSNLAFMKQKLSNIENDIKITEFSLTSYESYFSLVFPILYFRFRKEFKLSTFIDALSMVGESSYVTMCFTFPNFIVPLFVRCRDHVIRARIAALSPLFRYTLIPRLVNDPNIFSFLCIHFFGLNGPEILLHNFDCNIQMIPDIYKRLLNQDNDSEAYYLLIARCCAIKKSIEKEEMQKFMSSEAKKTKQLFMALLFYVTTYYEGLFEKITKYFTSDNEIFEEALGYIRSLTYIESGHIKIKIKNKIKNIIGHEFEIMGRNIFYDKFVAYLRSSITSVWDYLKSHTYGLSILKIVASNENKQSIVEYFPTSILNLTEFDIPEYEAMEYLVESYKAPIPDIRKVFTLEQMIENPAPALALTIIYLSKDHSMLKKVPLKIVFSASVDSPIFYHLASRIKEYMYNITNDLDKLPLPLETFVNTSPTECLNILKDISPDNMDQLNKEFYEKWCLLHYSQSLEFSLNTLSLLGAPSYFVYPTFIKSLPIHVLRNKYSLKIVLTCIITVLGSFSTYQENNGELYGSVVIIVYDLLDLFNDSLIDKETLGIYISKLLYNGGFLCNYFFERGISKSVLVDFCKYVPLPRVFFSALEEYAKKCEYRKLPFSISFMATYLETNSLSDHNLSIHNDTYQNYSYNDFAFIIARRIKDFISPEKIHNMKDIDWMNVTRDIMKIVQHTSSDNFNKSINEVLEDLEKIYPDISDARTEMLKRLYTP